MKHCGIFRGTVLLLHIAVLCITSQTVDGQRSYLVTDSSKSVGIKLIEGTDMDNARFIKSNKKSDAIAHTPDKVTEYGLNDGRVYVSREITLHGAPKKVFLERLIRGKITLYYLKTREGRFFYSEKDSILAPIVREDPVSEKTVFRDSLAVLMNDCSRMGNAARVAVYKKKSMSSLVKKYNSCLSRPLPFFKFGVILGYNNTRLSPPSKESAYDLKDVSFTPDKSFSAGIFCDIPLYLGGFYFHPEISFNANSFLYNETTGNIEKDIIVNSSTLSVPLMLKYALPKNKLRPFINAGCMISHDIRNKNAVYLSEHMGDVIEINKVNTYDIVSREQLGFSGGAGCEVDIDYRRSISLEVRYNYLLPITSDVTLKKDQLNLLIAFAF